MKGGRYISSKDFITLLKQTVKKLKRKEKIKKIFIK
jgi:hypothetical protein